MKKKESVCYQRQSQLPHDAVHTKQLSTSNLTNKITTETIIERNNVCDIVGSWLRQAWSCRQARHPRNTWTTRRLRTPGTTWYMWSSR